ncbi:MAG: CopG family antitoxin [Acidobacteriota bacterium]
MAESSSRSLPRWRSLDELVEYFDTHDMGEHLDQMRRVDLEVRIKKRRRLVAIDDEIIARVGEIAKEKSVSPEELINSWLRERVGSSR